MIKELKKFQIKLTPFQAVKEWNLNNTDNTNLLLLEGTGSDDYALSLEYVDYEDSSNEVPVSGSTCDISLEQQDNDLANVREGVKLSGPFYPGSDPQNTDGTYKRVVYSQVNTMFYNQYRNPTEMWGIENIDFELGKTKRRITDDIHLWEIPRLVFGDKIVPGSLEINNPSIDNEYKITDDGFGNLSLGTNIFSSQEEMRIFGNTFSPGSDATCNAYLNLSSSFPPPPASLVIITQPNDVLTYSGSNITFSVVAVGHPMPPYLTYQWISGSTNLTDNARITGSTTASLYINNVRSSDVGTYKVLVSNTNDSIYSNTVSLLLEAVSPAVFPGLAAWFDAGNLSASYSPGQGISTWKNGYGMNLTASGGTPTYTTSTFGGGRSSVNWVGFLNNNLNFTSLTSLDIGTSAWTIQFLVKGVALGSGYSQIFGDQLFGSLFAKNPTNIEITYASASFGPTVVTSQVLSTSPSGPIVATFVYSGSSVTFYEGKYTRGSNVLALGNQFFVNSIAGAVVSGLHGRLQGDIAEICAWPGVSLTQNQISILYDLYWKKKYPTEPFYG